MPISQFTIYAATDPGAPILAGLTGSLMNLFDACLVNGYGSGATFKSGSGWKKPMPNTGSIGCWQQPSGSLCTLLINDMGIPTGGTKEAWATGWQSLSDFSQTSSVGTGSGQFPLATQGVTQGSGSVIVRKSLSADSSSRNWVMYADAWTMYLFTLTGDTTDRYRGLWFGDFSSSFIFPETKKCVIHADNQKNQSTGGTTNGMNLDQTLNANQAMVGLFTQTGLNGRGNPSTCNKIVDPMKGVGNFLLQGNLPVPNPANNALYITPIGLLDATFATAIITYRGVFRGLYQLCCDVSNVADGQIFEGGNAYAGKRFQVVKMGSNGGMWAVEISNTVGAN